MLLSVVLLLTMLLSSAMTYLACWVLNKQLVQQLNGVLADQKSQIQELLNRIQAKDLHTFSVLQQRTANELPESVAIYPKTDEGEIAQMKDLYRMDDEDFYEREGDGQEHAWVMRQLGFDPLAE